MKIHALTVSEPFASLIASGEKRIENRSWPTKYRGPLAIHAGSGTQYLTKKELAGYPAGHVIAVANLVACLEFAEIESFNKDYVTHKLKPQGVQSTWADIAAHKHAEGPWCWILEDVRKLKIPKKIPGAQGIWSFFDREWEGRF